MLCCSAYGLWFGYYGPIIHDTTSYYVLIMSINHNNIVLCFLQFLRVILTAKLSGKTINNREDQSLEV